MKKIILGSIFVLLLSAGVVSAETLNEYRSSAANPSIDELLVSSSARSKVSLSDLELVAKICNDRVVQMQKEYDGVAANPNYPYPAPAGSRQGYLDMMLDTLNRTKSNCLSIATEISSKKAQPSAQVAPAPTTTTVHEQAAVTVQSPDQTDQEPSGEVAAASAPEEAGTSSAAKGAAAVGITGALAAGAFVVKRMFM